MSQHDTSTTTKTADVVIVGGGVIGLSIARELAMRGVHDMVVCDKGELGKEASWAAGGILGPQVEADCADEFFKLACASRDLYPEFARALRAETGVDVELETTGTLRVAFTKEEEIELRQRYEWQRHAGLRVEWLDSDNVRRLEPNLSPEVQCALRFPDDWQVENRKLVQALITANEKLGVRLSSNCAVTSLSIDRDRVVGVETENGTINVATVVLCAGAWTSSSLTTSESTATLEIEPVRGQMLCFKPTPQIARHVIYSRRGYLVPRHDGRLLAGSTSEHVGFDERLTAEGVGSIKAMAVEIAPMLEGAPLIDSWAGFRPRSLDDLPVIGRDAEIENLIYATGHYRNGILLAPITARIVTENLVNRGKSAWLESFSPKRFQCIAANA